MKLQKDGRTLAKEDIYLDLSKLGKEEIKGIPKILADQKEPIFEDERNLLLTGKYESPILYLGEYNVWRMCHKITRAEISYPDFVKLFQKEPTEITVADYKRLTGSAENAHIENPTCAENAQVENPQSITDDAPSDEVVHLAGGGKLTMDEYYSQKTNDEIEIAKKLLQENGYFVFPKAPEGDFPDLTGFEGVEMLCANGRSKEYIIKDYKPILKFGDFFYGSGTAKQLGQFRSVRQKPTPTVQELWEIAEEAGADLSKFEKPE